ncbi:MAG TPA: DUF3829 domain-containing protein [bacterium]|nr:DUF3829 domain-containing protein [bacterium]
MRHALSSLLKVTLCASVLAGTGCDTIKHRIEALKNRGKPAPGTLPTPPVPPTPATPPVPPVAPPLPPTETQATAPETAPSAPTGPGDDSTLIDKINGYIACSNRTVSRTVDSRTRYLSWVNEQAGPTCTERYISYGLYTLYEDGVQKCNEAVTRGKALPPSMPKLEQAAADLAAAYAELVPLTQKAEDYYQQQDYKDDNCAKAKAMHPQLMAAFNKFIASEKVLASELDGLKSELDIKQLAKIEQEQGKKLQWHTQNFMMNTRNLIRTVPKENAANFDAAAYIAAFNSLQVAYDPLIEYSAAHADEASGAFWYSAFESSAKNFFTKAKFLKRDAAEGKKPDARTLNELLDEYNRLVGDANNLRFKFP